MREYYPQNFSKLTDTQKMDLFQRTVQLVEKELGLVRHYDVKINTDKDGNFGGYYTPTSDPYKGYITIAESTINSSDTAYLFNTFFHELKHAEQDEIRNNIKQEPNDRRKQLLLAQSCYDETIKIDGIPYHGEQIPDYVRFVNFYVSIPSDNRMTMADKTSEAMLFYEIQPKEREASEYGMKHYKMMIAQMQKELKITPYASYEKFKFAYDYTHEAQKELKKLFPNSKDIQTDVENVILNLYNQKNNTGMVYEVSSKELEWALKWSMSQSAVRTERMKKGGSTFIDPRTMIDQKQMMQKRAEMTKSLTKNYVYTSNGKIATRAEKEVNGHIINSIYDSKAEKRLEQRVERAINKRKNGYLQNETLDKIVKYFKPTTFDFLDEKTKKALIGACINKIATNLQLSNQYSPLFIKEKTEYKPNGNYLINHRIKIDLSASSIDILRSIGYNMHKAYQQELVKNPGLEMYNGQRMVYTIQNQLPIAIKTKDRFEIGDMYIVEPKFKDNFLMTFKDTSKDFYMMHRLQPVERDASRYSDRLVEIVIDEMKNEPSQTTKTQNAINRFNESSYRKIFSDFTHKSLMFMPNIESEINRIFVNIYAEAAGREPLYTNVDNKLMERFKNAQLDSHTYRTEKQVFVNPNIIKEQQNVLKTDSIIFTPTMNQNNTSNQANTNQSQMLEQNEQQKENDNQQGIQFSLTDFRDCIDNIPEIKDTQQITHQEQDDDLIL